MNTKQGVYKILNKIDNKFYYGSTAICFLKRWKKHVYELNANRHKNNYLQNAWNKYGQSNFEFNIVLVCDPENCLYYEQLFLDRYWDGKIQCYNLSPSAGNNRNIKLSDKTKIKIGNAHRNKKLSEEQIKNISARMMGPKNPNFGKGLYGDCNPMFGKKHSESTITKIRQKALLRGPENNSCAKLDWIKVNNIRKQYKTGKCTQRELAHQYGVGYSTLCSIINNKSWIIL